MPSDRAKIDHRSIGVLGVLTICAYGSWYYSFGVLLDPIRNDTGWSEATLASSFSTGTILIGVSALFGGRMLDVLGHRPVFLLGGLIGTSGLITASLAEQVAVFFAGAAIGLGAIGSLGFYHVTMTTAVRLNPDQPTRAIAVLTVWGAFASAIFLPAADWLESMLGWRGASRILAAAAGTAFAAAALLLPSTTPSDSPSAPARPSLPAIVRSTVAEPAPRLFTAAVGLGGLAMSTMLVFQVAVMTAAGLSSATAASMAGLRGFCQLGGRVPLSPIVNRLGRDRALMTAFAAMAIGGALLPVAGTVPVAIAFAVVAGFGIGAFSPLQGMKGEELFDRSQLGATMGFYGAVLLLVGSPGPIIGGIIVERTDEPRWVAIIVVAAATGALVATAALARLTTPHRSPRATSTG